jgi:hypothetical protein
MSTELTKNSTSYQFDDATDTSFLGKTDRNTFVFRGVASNVSSIVDLPVLFSFLTRLIS